MPTGGRAVSPTARVFPARLTSVALAVAFVEEACGAAGVERHDRLRLGLLVEELLTNTIVHGHGGDCDAPVSLSLEVRAGQVALTYEDTAPQFDPFARADATPGAASLEGRPVGRLGLVLVRGMATDIAYARVEGRNRISLVLRPGEAHGPDVPG
jgi:anti-sigma regulatory factor (Ser/Thr protein kinase)